MSAPGSLPAVRIDSDRRAFAWCGACSACDNCRSGWSAWCTTAPAPGHWQPLAPHVPHRPRMEHALAAALGCLDILAQDTTAHPGDTTLLVLGPAQVLTPLRVVLAHARIGAVHVADETLTGDDEFSLAAARAAMAGQSGTGRADTIVSLRGRLDLASRWVRRGGRVASLTCAGRPSCPPWTPWSPAK